MAAVLQANERVKEVRIEGLVRGGRQSTTWGTRSLRLTSSKQALLKIVKHCQESLPHMVTGSLLGLSVGDGVLEVTHSFPFPDSRHDKNDDDDNIEGHEFQLEMMRMLREVNVDNNCVGWYQSMYLGIFSTSSLLENQFSYQTDLSPNAVVLLYDPMQTANGQLVLRCYRLTEKVVKIKKEGTNTFVPPSEIFEEVPVTFANPGLARALLSDVVVKDTTMADRLDLSTNPYLEKHLEFLCGWVDDLATEQQKFQYYNRQLNRSKEKKDWESADAPRRMESLLITNQISSYCEQMNKFASAGLSKLELANGLHKEEK